MLQIVKDEIDAVQRLKDAATEARDYAAVAKHDARIAALKPIIDKLTQIKTAETHAVKNED